MIDEDNRTFRKELSSKRRVVVKFGTRIITGGSYGPPDRAHLKKLAKELAAFYQKPENELVLVSSGAIGSGMEALGLKQKPESLAKTQMCASLGQARLMSLYEDIFSEFDIKVGQVLLTRDGLENEKRLSHMKNAMLELFENKALPIVNENDVVSVEELRFGDNDLLAALVSKAIKADLLVLMTSSDGLKDIEEKESLDLESAKRIALLKGITQKEFDMVKDLKDELSTGGMQSKLEASKVALQAGVWAGIIDGRKEAELSSFLEGKDTGTLIIP